MVPSHQKLRDRVAIVTGGARDIGQAIALRYAREGAEVVIADRKERKLERLWMRLSLQVARPLSSTLTFPKATQ
jgi:NAD(P)-dependent dehydrogenase (short-subunit alcohol dehydrogenase family)